MAKNNNDRLVNFLLEAGVLKRLPRAGWLDAGIPNPETIAEHSFRTALMAWVLADVEGADSEKAVKMVLFHDIHETRTGDNTPVTKLYLNHAEAEAKAIADISANLPTKRLANEYKSLMAEFLRGRTLEAKVARDADKLEQLLQAKEYSDIGYRAVEEWTDVKLSTKSAKKLAREMKKGKLQDWWQFCRGPAQK